LEVRPFKKQSRIEEGSGITGGKNVVVPLGFSNPDGYVMEKLE
jgi:hypothetical protein